MANPIDKPDIRSYIEGEAPLTIVFFNSQCTQPARPVCLAAANVSGSMSVSWIPRHSGVLDMEGESP